MLGPEEQQVEDHEISMVYDYDDQQIIYTTDDEQIVIMNDD